MATGQISEVLQHLRRAAVLREGAGLTDGQLLQDYLCRRDESALAALVRRHGPMVWGVCRRVLGNYHDAEDAFQATFLVLVRKAASIALPELLANWLYGVAHQTALKARATTAKRRTRERQVTQMPEPAVTEPDPWNDLQPLLDQELSRLTDKYRIAIVLCDLEGKTRKEAARHLGAPEGTLAARLARGRAMLAKRLARHGLAVSTGSLAALLTQNVASSAPPSVAAATIKVASLFAAGPTASAGLISVNVAALTRGVLKAMALTKLKIVTAVLVMLAVVAAGASLTRFCAPAAEPPNTDKLISKDGARPEPRKRIIVRQNAILQRMAMSPDGEVVATVGVTYDGSTFNSTVKLWDARTGKLKRALDEEKDSQLEIAFSRDLLAIGVNGKLKDTNPRGPREVRLLDAKTLEPKYKIDERLVPGVSGWSGLSFSPDGKRLALAGHTFSDGFVPFVKLWDIAKQKLIEGTADRTEIPHERNRIGVLPSHPTTRSWPPRGIPARSACSCSTARRATSEFSWTRDSSPTRSVSVVSPFPPTARLLRAPGRTTRSFC